jgi:hypothetical protein
MYAKIKNNEVVKAPYDISDLFSECPETKGRGADIVALFNDTQLKQQERSEIVFVEVEPFPQYDSKVVCPTGALDVKMNNGKWVATYVFREYTQEEIATINVTTNPEVPM